MQARSVQRVAHVRECVDPPNKTHGSLPWMLFIAGTHTFCNQSEKLRQGG